MSTQPESGALRLIREHALRSFSERGYRGTSLRAIAADAQCDVALIPYYFKNKSNLFRTLVGESVEEARAGIIAGYEEAARVGADIGGDGVAPSSIAGHHLEWWSESDSSMGVRAVLVAIAEGGSVPPEISEFSRAQLQTCADLIIANAPEEHRYAVASFTSMLLGTTILRDFVGWERITRMSTRELVDAQVEAFDDILRLSVERAARGEPFGAVPAADA